MSEQNRTPLWNGKWFLYKAIWPYLSDFTKWKFLDQELERFIAKGIPIDSVIDFVISTVAAEVLKRTRLSSIYWAAIMFLKKNSESSTPRLIAICEKTNDPRVRNGFVRVLGDVGDGRALELLTQSLTDTALAKLAAAALARLGEPGKKVLCSALTHPDKVVAHIAAETLAQIPHLLLGDIGQHGFQLLCSALSHSDEIIARAAAETLVTINDRVVVQPLIDAFLEGENKGKNFIAAALQRIRTCDAQDLFVPLIECPHPCLRISAAVALKHLGTRLAIAPLIASLRGSSDDLACAIASALKPILDRIRPDGTETQDRIEVVQALLDRYEAGWVSSPVPEPYGTRAITSNSRSWAFAQCTLAKSLETFLRGPVMAEVPESVLRRMCEQRSYQVIYVDSDPEGHRGYDAGVFLAKEAVQKELNSRGLRAS